jgi:hypothetical protein
VKTKNNGQSLVSVTTTSVETQTVNPLFGALSKQQTGNRLGNSASPMKNLIVTQTTAGQYRGIAAAS